MKTSEVFDIPVALVIFKRAEKSLEIISRISQVKPSKIYLISDGGRNDEEWEVVSKCRQAVEDSINWDCDVIKDYAEENKGVYDRIGLGACRVFDKERWAIFLEDDNLPEISFFYFCREMLHRYEGDQGILWICGTNYLENCTFKSQADYGITRCMLPCGWASWSNKFLSSYDKDFSEMATINMSIVRGTYLKRRLFYQDLRNWRMEINHRKKGERYTSWDYQMSFSLRSGNKVGIIPKHNLIKNIGVDENAIHGGGSFHRVMTQRFCGMASIPLPEIIKHPDVLEIDAFIESRIEGIILEPIRLYIERFTVKILRAVFNIPENERIITYFKRNIKGTGRVKISKGNRK